jgi:hypothetical protein
MFEFVHSVDGAGNLFEPRRNRGDTPQEIAGTDPKNPLFFVKIVYPLAFWA